MKTFDRDRETPNRERRFVSVSEYHVATAGETLVAYGLGACVAVALYDEEAGIGGLAHTLLPNRTDGLDAASGKYVDAAIHTMLTEMVDAGADYSTVEARLVGGADIFEFEELGKGVGEKNAAVAREELAKLDVPVVAEATGGDFGRTVEFDTETGDVEITTVRHGSQTM